MSASNKEAPNGLINFQKSYGIYLRDPCNNQRPAAIPYRASQIYESLLFNNISGFINNCFPVAKQLFTAEQWQHICRCFFSQWRCHTPYFSEIPKEFVTYIQEHPHALELPAWFSELIYYEWVELDIDTSNAIALNTPKKLKKHRAQDGPLLFTTPTLRNLAFEWPVHKITATSIPTEPQATFLAVFRNSQHKVAFMEINAVTAALLEIFEQAPSSANQAIMTLAQLLQHPEPESLITFGQNLVDDFIAREILMTNPT